MSVLHLTAPPLAGPVIETQGLTRIFGELVAVDRLDLAVERGVIFGLLGPNGAGKSTTIRMLTTLLPPTSGSARVAGFDIGRQAPDVRRHIGYVPQLVSADGGLTGAENLTLSARLYRVPRAARRQRIADALVFMDLVDAADQLVRTYSGGMIRRLEVAQAMLHEPEVLFLDEPTIGLDPIARRAVWDRLRELKRRSAMTILLTTHDMEEADALCDRLAIMHDGTLALAGVPSELKAALGPEASLEDVFVETVGGSIEEGGTYRDVRQLRSTARRLG
ncbi:MAG TPA: ATP-binding cassette domain-containing protein [Gemmatimonadales bacterium]|nr:ATP-binding cassette domain-containing protein [Gemmatimonadales bacterium]